MNKMLPSVILMCFFLTPISVFKISFLSYTYDIIVPDDYSSIQEAINAAQPGQTIYVRRGIYEEYLIINKTLSITGENASTTCIKGDGTQALIKIRAGNISFSGFTLKDAETGVLLNNVRDCRINNNIIENMSVYSLSTAGMGIYATNCQNLTISENLIRYTYYNDVCFKSTRDSRIVRNTLIANWRLSQPVFLVSSQGNLIGWNKVLGLHEMNEGGIGLLDSNYSTILYNDIRENDWCGISLRASNHTTVKGNNVTKHSWWGIMIKNSHNVTVYLNNFVKNNIQLLTESVENVTWSFDNCGNFWSDYTGKDENNDGIGDVPYTYDGEEIDFYPLMGMFRCFELTKGNESFSLEIVSNSTIHNLRYLTNATYMEGIIEFNVSGTPGKHGFCRIKLPHSLMEDPYNVMVDGGSPKLFKEIATGQDYTTLYFSYLHENKQKTIIIVYENIGILTLIALTAASVFAIAALHRNRSINFPLRFRI